MATYEKYDQHTVARHKKKQQKLGVIYDEEN